MKKLTATSSTNFALEHGENARVFILHCERFSGQLADSADEQKSKPLSAYMRDTASQIDALIVRLNTVLGSA